METPEQISKATGPDIISPGLGRTSLRLIERNKPPEIVPKPIQSAETEADNVDVYTNTLCYGSGTAHDPQLCTTCFLTTPQLKSQEMINLDAFSAITTWLTRPGSPVRRTTLIGGEFALHPDAKTMVQRTHDAGLGVRIVTNGSHQFVELASDGAVAAILRDPEERGSMVAVSLDASRRYANDRQRGEGAYDMAIDAMEFLHEQRIPFRVNATITRRTMGSILELAQLAERKGAKALLVHTFSPVGRGAALGKPNTNPDELENASFYSIDPEIPHFYPKVITGALARPEWQRILQLPERYESPGKRTANPDFHIEVEQGYADETLCALRGIQKVSLQFMPPTARTAPYLPVVACGMFAAKADRLSAYLFDPVNGELYPRAGESELTIALRSTTAGCPALPGVEEFACIYDRVKRNAAPEASS